MATTIAEIKERATGIEPSVRPKCFYINPLALKCIKDMADEGIRLGEIVHAIGFDEVGKYPNTVTLKETGYWWDVECFEIVEDATTEVKPCEHHDLSHDIICGCKCRVCGITLCGSGHPDNTLFHCNRKESHIGFCQDTTRPDMGSWPINKAHVD